jgi:CAAX protease family protein
MEATVSDAKRSFPYANWGPLAAVLGVPLALATGVVLAIPAALAGQEPNGDLTNTANALAQLAAEAAFFMVPMLIAARRGASFKQALRRLGVRAFRPSAVKWMLAAIGAYLLLAIAYTAIFGQPEEKDIADKLGAVPVQILLIVIVAPCCEEVCFRGMLFGGLRERLPRLAAALISGAVFGALHVTNGVEVIAPLIGFGFILALLYEKTGSIVPGILLHMLNNSVALLGQ